MEAALYCVATPIGNLGDITERAVEVLRGVDLVYAEDTRVTRKLLTHLGIRQTLVSLHEHNENQRVDEIAGRIRQGESVALVSDAGTPLISDPGYQAVSQLVKQGVRVIPVPGASAIITALSAAGLPTDRFAFEGFLPAKPSSRRKVLEGLANESRTLVLYESSHRIADLLQDLSQVFGEQREVVLARELTKLYEQFYRGTVDELLVLMADDEYMGKGEFVVMVAAANTPDNEEQTELETRHLLEVLVDELSVKQAAQIAARLTGQSKNALYRQAVEIGRSVAAD